MVLIVSHYPILFMKGDTDLLHIPSADGVVLGMAWEESERKLYTQGLSIKH